jgi:hypothetical protein
MGQPPGRTGERPPDRRAIEEGSREEGRDVGSDRDDEDDDQQVLIGVVEHVDRIGAREVSLHAEGVWPGRIRMRRR